MYQKPGFLAAASKHQGYTRIPRIHSSKQTPSIHRFTMYQNVRVQTSRREVKVLEFYKI